MVYPNLIWEKVKFTSVPQGRFKGQGGRRGLRDEGEFSVFLFIFYHVCYQTNILPKLRLKILG